VSQLLPILGGVLLAWFVLALFHEAYFKELLYDDAYNASVAKNFSLGLGWVSSYHDYLPFNPRVTTGPTLLLPLAGAIALFGHPEWLPNVTNSALMLLVLIACARQLRFLLDCEDWWVPCLAILLLLSLYDRNTWVVFIGDGVLALLLALIFLRLGPTLAEPGRRSHLALGLLCGLALLSKFYALIALTALPVTWLLYHWQGGGRPSWSNLAYLLLGAGLLLLPWQLYRELSLAALPVAERADHAEFAREFFLSAGSGLGPLLAADHPLLYLQDNLYKNFQLLARQLDIYGRGEVLTGLLLLSVAGLTLRLLFKPGKSAFEWSLTALGLGACAHFGWFLLFMHSPWIHYARIGVILSIFFLPLHFSPLLRGRAVLAAALLFLALLPAHKQQAWADFMSFQAERTQGSKDLEALVLALDRTQYPAPLAGCGWLVPRMLEYRLPGSLHMQDCMLLIQEQLREEEQAGQGPVSLSQPLVFTIPMHNILWDWAGRGHRMERSIKQYCPDSLWDSPTYSILRCEVDELPEELLVYLRDYRFRS